MGVRARVWRRVRVKVGGRRVGACEKVRLRLRLRVKAALWAGQER